MILIFRLVPVTLIDLLPETAEPDAVFDAFAGWSKRRGLALYPHQEEALIEIVSGANVILSAPTGSGKSLVAAGAHFSALAEGRRTFYTAPSMALRDGAAADVGQVVMDEFHFYAEPERGWAWQVPLIELPRAQFLLMSATLGDMTRFERDLSRRTGRPTAVVRSAA